ncbi:MAG: N,N-dimethylformamidase [Geminicoccaceae bacterium]|nr:N,N-dimethylformamidase [Geminicoccaceae bacterium]HRY25796.1 N,N-dimethylformamidase large subunit [Geminicoccaceae bacterium]
MTRIMGYCDRWSVRPGDTVNFMVSCIGAESYAAEIVRLKQPEAGPLATPFEPEPVASDVNGRYAGREQALPIGSLAVVTGHPCLERLEAATLVAYVMPTTPSKGRQALFGNWCEASRTGFGLELDEQGSLVLRLGAGRGTEVTLATGEPMRAWRWYRVAGTFDSQSGRMAIWQEPVSRHGFDLDRPIARSAERGCPSTRSMNPLTFAAWQNGETAGPSAWGGLQFAQHFNGRIDRPRIVEGALDHAGIAELMGETGPAAIEHELVAAWDFSLDIGGEAIIDTGPNRLHGTIVNLPTRAVHGHNWTGCINDWTQAPEQYGAIHFHDDDIVDACWTVDFSFEVTSAQRSGVYAAKLTAGDFVFWVPFFVSPPKGEARSKVAFIASTATYTVYLNNKGRFLSSATEVYQGRVTVMDEIDSLLFEYPAMGLSTYDRHSDGTGVAYASRHRPVHNFRPTGRHWNFNLDLCIIDWLEHLGGDYDVITEEQLHEEGMGLLAPYNVVITGSHPEYDSLDMLDAFQAYLRRGGRLMYMGGNGFYWRIAHHPTRDGVIEVRRAEGGVRAWDALPGEYHHSFTGEYGGLWRRNSRAPQKLVGVGFISQGFDKCSYYRRTDAAADPRAAWMFDGIEDELIGDFGILQGGAAGLEIDAVDARLGTPPHALVVAQSENHSNTYEVVAEEVLIPHGATDAIINPEIHADITFFETPNGGAVWSTGSIAFAGSLGWNGFDNNVARLTTNVLRRFAAEEPLPWPGRPEAGA